MIYHTYVSLPDCSILFLPIITNKIIHQNHPPSNGGCGWCCNAWDIVEKPPRAPSTTEAPPSWPRSHSQSPQKPKPWCVVWEKNMKPKLKWTSRIEHDKTFGNTCFNYLQLLSPLKIGPTWSLHVVKKQPMDGPRYPTWKPLIVQPCGVIVVALCPVHVEGRQVLGNKSAAKTAWVKFGGPAKTGWSTLDIEPGFH